MDFLYQIIGPAIGGIIAVVAGYCFTKWEKNNEQKRKKTFFARVFLSELKKINTFVDKIHEIANKDNFLLTQDVIEETFELTPAYDAKKELKLIEFFKDNPYYRITGGSQFITEKNPFEMFYSEIYSFENEKLIDDLINIEKLLNDANSCLLLYYEKPRGMYPYVSIFNFLVNIEETKKIVQKILYEKILERMAE